MEIEQEIKKECDSICQLLLSKNKSYGNSVMVPLRIFSQAEGIEQIKVRIDDKLSRIQKGKEYKNEDTIQDLIGYLILLKIALNNVNIKTNKY